MAAAVFYYRLASSAMLSCAQRLQRPLDYPTKLEPGSVSLHSLERITEPRLLVITEMMPRRIPDYPDSFYGWNYVSSLGSFISTGATATFLVVVYRALTSREPVAANAWGYPAFFTDLAAYQTTTVSYPTVEFVLPNPTPMHAFQMMPIQS